MCNGAAYYEVYSSFGLRTKPKDVKDAEELGRKCAAKGGKLAAATIGDISNRLRQIKAADPEGHHIACTFLWAACPPEVLQTLSLNQAF